MSSVVSAKRVCHQEHGTFREREKHVVSCVGPLDVLANHQARIALRHLDQLCVGTLVGTCFGGWKHHIVCCKAVASFLGDTESISVFSRGNAAQPRRPSVGHLLQSRGLRCRNRFGRESPQIVVVSIRIVFQVKPCAFHECLLDEADWQPGTRGYLADVFQDTPIASLSSSPPASSSLVVSPPSKNGRPSRLKREPPWRAEVCP